MAAPDLLFHRRLRIGQDLEHRLTQFGLIADLTQRLPSSAAHRGSASVFASWIKLRARSSDKSVPW